MNNPFPFQLPFDLPEVKPENVPYAYAAVLVALLLVTRSPSKVVSYASTFMLWKKFVQDAQSKISS